MKPAESGEEGRCLSRFRQSVQYFVSEDEADRSTVQDRRGNAVQLLLDSSGQEGGGDRTQAT